jgi:hypothetical protein
MSRTDKFKNSMNNGKKENSYSMYSNSFYKTSSFPFKRVSLEANIDKVLSPFTTHL